MNSLIPVYEVYMQAIFAGCAQVYLSETFLLRKFYNDKTLLN
jgi:hypothetical protein